MDVEIFYLCMKTKCTLRELVQNCMVHPGPFPKGRCLVRFPSKLFANDVRSAASHSSILQFTDDMEVFKKTVSILM